MTDCVCGLGIYPVCHSEVSFLVLCFISVPCTDCIVKRITTKKCGVSVNSPKGMPFDGYKTWLNKWPKKPLKFMLNQTLFFNQSCETYQWTTANVYWILIKVEQ